MTLASSRLESRVQRPRRSRVVLRWVLRILVVIVTFGAGVAVGQAIQDRPRAGKPVTNVSTIQPWTQTRTQP